MIKIIIINKPCAFQFDIKIIIYQYEIYHKICWFYDDSRNNHNIIISDDMKLLPPYVFIIFRFSLFSQQTSTFNLNTSYFFFQKKKKKLYSSKTLYTHIHNNVRIYLLV